MKKKTFVHQVHDSAVLSFNFHEKKFVFVISNSSLDKVVASLASQNVDLKLAMDAVAVGSHEIIAELQKNYSFRKLNLMKIVPLQNGSKILFDESSGKLKVKAFEGSEKIKVLIVEDSRTMQNILSKIFSSHTEFEVIGQVESGEDALIFLKDKTPDVITLDINLKKMSGVDFLKEMKKGNMIPTILVSSLNINDGDTVFEALRQGAVDYIQKPDLKNMDLLSREIIEKVKTIASSNLDESHHSTDMSSGRVRFESDDCEVPIVIGSSTGGTAAIERILEKIDSKDIPPILIIQHIPPMFSKSFADRLNAQLKFTVKEAEDGDYWEKNKVLVAPGGKHVSIKYDPSVEKMRVHLTMDPPMNRFRPSVDYSMKSVASAYKGPLVAVILTGMGKDGAQGIKMLHDSGAVTIAQDKDSSVVFGMPKAAIDIGAVDIISNVQQMAVNFKHAIHKVSKKRESSKAS